MLTSVNAGPSVASGAVPAWIRGRVAIDGSGNATVVWLEDSSGNPVVQPVAVQYAIDGSGNVSAPALLKFGGKMSPAKDLVVATLSNLSTAVRPSLRVYQKVIPGTTFSSADITSATFDYHLLLVGDGAGWEHGTGTTDGARVFSFVGRTTSAGAAPDLPGVGTLSIDSSGVVTAQEIPSLKGFLSADKALLVVTMQVSASPRLHAIIVATRHTGSYAMAELEGGWTLDGFVSGTAGEAAWGRGQLSVSGAGALAFTSWLDSTGDTTLPTLPAVAVSASGVVTMPSDTTSGFHAQVAPGKKLLAATATEDLGIYSMLLFVR
jgi:hypothetical protein